MKTVTPEELTTAYNKADASGKKLLETLFGADSFNPQTSNRPLTLKEACERQGYDHKTILPYDDPQNALDIVTNARRSLDIIADDIRNGWVANWQDVNQQKWYCWFKMSAGVGFSSSCFDFVCTYSAVGSRLSFRNTEDAEFFGKQFPDLHKIVLE